MAIHVNIYADLKKARIVFFDEFCIKKKKAFLINWFIERLYDPAYKFVVTGLYKFVTATYNFGQYLRAVFFLNAVPEKIQEYRNL